MQGTRSFLFTVGAVTLVTFLSLVYTVDGQWRRSVSGEIVCDLQKLNRCVEMGERMLQDPRYVFPDTDTDVRDVCQEWENITMCMEEAMRTCVKFPDNEKQLFNNNVGKSIIYVSEICTKEQEKLEYLQHAPCLKEMTRNDFEYCGSYYGQLLAVTRDFKNGIERDEELCCGLNLYKECMLGKFNKCQRKMLGVFGEDPFKKGRKYVGALLDNALNAQSQHCSSLNYVMSSFNCPQMDKLREETAREATRLEVDNRDFQRNPVNNEPASARSQPSMRDDPVVPGGSSSNNRHANDRRGGRIDDPGFTSPQRIPAAGAGDPSRATSNNNGGSRGGVDQAAGATDAPTTIDPPGRGPLRDRVNPGTDGFRDNRERGGRRNDGPDSNARGTAGGYFGNVPASTSSQTDPRDSASDPSSATSNNNNNDAGGRDRDSYFGGRTNYAGGPFGFDGRPKPNNPRPTVSDPWENPRVSPNDINAQGLSGGRNGAAAGAAAAATAAASFSAVVAAYLAVASARVFFAGSLL